MTRFLHPRWDRVASRGRIGGDDSTDPDRVALDWINPCALNDEEGIVF
jgi:hypothetical protein